MRKVGLLRKGQGMQKWELHNCDEGRKEDKGKAGTKRKGGERCQKEKRSVRAGKWANAAVQSW